jgi:dTDP-4-dehydrorhamnose 3,5-epimerase
MEFKELALKGIIEITPRIFEDERGMFFEAFNDKVFKDNGLDVQFVQDNQSFSVKNVVRGLHFQKEPFAQGKLVRVISGKVLDIVVDIRKDSATYGQHLKVILDGKKNNMVYVPGGFAHGFTALEDTVFIYKCTHLYNKSAESGILWSDPQLAIDWEVANPILSEKDKFLSLFSQIN